MSQPITSLDELKNTIAFGLPLWALVRFESGSRIITPMLNPKFETGARGTKLVCQGDASLDDYLARWNIEDHDNHHTVYSYGHTVRWVFNSMIDAEIYLKKMPKRSALYG